MIPPTRPGYRRVLVPDLDGEPLAYLRALEEILLDLGAGDDTPDQLGEADDFALPAALDGLGPLEAVRRLLAALVETQGIGEAQGRMLAPPGQHPPGLAGTGPYEHNPLTEITIDDADVQALASIAAELGRPHLEAEISEIVETYAPTTGPAYNPGAWLPELIEHLARLAGLLDLAWTTDADLIAPRARQRAAGNDVVFTDEEEAAYQRLADRFNTIASGDAITRWLY